MIADMIPLPLFKSRKRVGPDPAPYTKAVIEDQNHLGVTGPKHVYVLDVRPATVRVQPLGVHEGPRWISRGNLYPSMEAYLDKAPNRPFDR